MMSKYLFYYLISTFGVISLVKCLFAMSKCGKGERETQPLPVRISSTVSTIEIVINHLP